jgi:hypothetical protein
VDFRFTLVQLCAGWSSLFDISTFWYEINFDLLSCLSLLSCCCTFSLFERSQLACWLSYHGIRSKLYNPPWSVDTSFLQIRVARSPSQSLQMYQIEVGFVTPSFLICGSTRWRLTCYLLYFQLLRQTCLQVLNKTFWRSSSATSFNMFQPIPNNSHLSFNDSGDHVTSRGPPLRPCWRWKQWRCQYRIRVSVEVGHGGQRVSVSCTAMSTLGRPISDARLCNSGNISNRAGHKSRRSEDVRSRFQAVRANLVAGRKVM